jgi:hypothetical protein
MTAAFARPLVRPALALAAFLTFAGCGGDETSPTEHATPKSAKLVVGATTVTQGGTLTGTHGQTTRVEIQFFDSTGAQITGIDTEHFATLTFTPAALAAAADVADHHFQKDVTFQAAAGTGSVMVGYGHDAAADEANFGPFTVTVQ